MEVCFADIGPVAGAIRHIDVLSLQRFFLSYRHRCMQQINNHGELCKKLFTSRKGLLTHIQNKHRHRQGWDCDQCEVRCSSKYALKTHKEEKHSTDTRSTFFIEYTSFSSCRMSYRQFSKTMLSIFQSGSGASMVADTMHRMRDASRATMRYVPVFQNISKSSSDALTARRPSE